MTKIKICGITTYEDAINAAKLGADYLGFNFYAKSPRYIKSSKAKRIIEKLKEQKFQQSIKIVGIFVNEKIDKIKDICDFCKIDLIQLSGDENLDFLRKLRSMSDKSIIKAFRIKNETNKKISSFEGNFFPSIDYILLDSYKKGIYGGTGSKFDWKIIKGINNKKLFLSGGINASNVREAINVVKPYAVDVCSSIERYPRKKDLREMKKFIYEVKTKEKNLTMKY